jgi:hypothetical protein
VPASIRGATAPGFISSSGPSHSGYLDLYGQHGEGRLKQLELSAARSAEMIDELEAKKRQIEETIDELRLINTVCLKKIAQKKAR